MRTRYSVAAWGVGELWTLGDVVLAHDFRFLVDGELEEHAEGVAGALGARPPEGAQGPPNGTVATISSRMGHDIVSSQHRGNGTSQSATPDELGARVNHYLAGSNVSFRDVELDLSWATPFQRAVADALRGVPRGEVVTYGELAALAGFPGAARATGSFCARNRFELLVPCHRVVAAAGIGGYGTTGTHVKRRLLALEGAVA